MGVYDEFTGGKSEEEWIREGFENSGCQERVSWEEFKEKGYYAAPTSVGWENNPRGFAPFCEDPEANPLGTPSGKLEFYSTALAHHFPDDESRPPFPKFIASDDRLSESLLTERGEAYPYLIVSNHPRWRVHANMDDITWFREIETCKVKGPDGYLYEPVWINPVDAEGQGIATGDVVKIFNDRGWVLGRRIRNRAHQARGHLSGSRCPARSHQSGRGGSRGSEQPHSAVGSGYEEHECRGNERLSG